MELNKEKTYVEVADIVGRKYSTVMEWAKRYRADGLSFLDDRPRSGRPVEITGEERAKITALACSEPPEGYARWSLRLLTDKVVELGICEHLFHNQAGVILKKTNCSPT
jgi:transposase